VVLPYGVTISCHNFCYENSFESPLCESCPGLCVDGALRTRPKTRSLSVTPIPRAIRIFLLVSSRHGLPDSTRSIVRVETPALRASSALLIMSDSRNLWTLLLGTESPPATVHPTRPNAALADRTFPSIGLRLRGLERSGARQMEP